MNLFEHFDVPELTLYVAFHDEAQTVIALTEEAVIGNPSVSKYFIQDSDVASLIGGYYTVAIREGDFLNPSSAHTIVGVATFHWTGDEVATGHTGGGVLRAWVAYSTLSPSEYLTIVQGEVKVITFIVEAQGRFNQAVFPDDSISVTLIDPAGTVISKQESDGSIERVCQELDVQIIRCTLSAVNTAALSDGLITIEIAFDKQKVQLTHSLKIAEAL